MIELQDWFIAFCFEQFFCRFQPPLKTVPFEEAYLQKDFLELPPLQEQPAPPPPLCLIEVFFSGPHSPLPLKRDFPYLIMFQGRKYVEFIFELFHFDFLHVLSLIDFHIVCFIMFFYFSAFNDLHACFLLNL